MSKTKIIVAESNNILLNGISDILQENTDIEVLGKVSRYNHLCQLIDKNEHDLVVLGPMISTKYRQLLIKYLLKKYPYLKIVQISFNDNYKYIQDKVKEALM